MKHTLYLASIIRKTLAIQGSDRFGYPDVVLGCSGFTMFLRLTGSTDAKLILTFPTSKKSRQGLSNLEFT